MKKRLFLSFALLPFIVVGQSREYHFGALSSDNNQFYFQLVDAIKRSTLQESALLLPLLDSIYRDRMKMTQEFLHIYRKFYTIPQGEDFKYVNSTDEAIQIFKEKTGKYFKLEWNDLMNTHQDLFANEIHLPLYIPLYDRSDNSVVSFLLISAGVDGKYDNQPLHEKYYTDDWRNKIKAYNIAQIDACHKQTGMDAEKYPGGWNCLDTLSGINLVEMMQGGKDLIIMVGSDKEIHYRKISRTADTVQTSAYINSQYIPADLEECYSELDRLLTKEQKRTIKAKGRQGITDMHRGMGQFIRNRFGLTRHSRLYWYFINNKLVDQTAAYPPDDMSRIILTGYYEHLKKK